MGSQAVQTAISTFLLENLENFAFFQSAKINCPRCTFSFIWENYKIDKKKHVVVQNTALCYLACSWVEIAKVYIPRSPSSFRQTDPL